MSNFKKDWVDFEYLTPYLENGDVKYIEDSHPYFEKILNKYPIGFYRIDWEKLPHREMHIEKRYPNNKSDIENAVKKIFIEENILDNTMINICFDGITEGGLSMSSKLFLFFASEILNSPQHIYVMPNDAKWCLNYTMERYLYFGYCK